MNLRLAIGDSFARSVAVSLLPGATNLQMSFCAPRRSTKIRDFGRSAIFGGRMTFPGLWTTGRFLLTRNGRRKNDRADALRALEPVSCRRTDTRVHRDPGPSRWCQRMMPPLKLRIAFGTRCARARGFPPARA